MEAREVPAVYGVSLTGTEDHRAATVTDDIGFKAGVPAPAGVVARPGERFVDAASPQAAVLALVQGKATASWQGKSDTYTFGPSAVTLSPPAHPNREPFALSRPDAAGRPGEWRLGLEDLAGPNMKALGAGGDADWDYDDKVWVLNVRQPQVPQNGTGDGLIGRYYRTIDLTGPANPVRIDPKVDFNWAGGAPTGDQFPSDDFSVRWTGLVQPRYTGRYTFSTNSDDGVRLSVNGQQLINNWATHAPTVDKGTVDLVAGTKYAITMEYFEQAGGAVAQLFWESDNQAKEVVSVPQLYTNAGSVGDRVWDDKNGNGLQDAGEGGVGGVTVRLLKPDGSADQETKTAAGGSYKLIGLDPAVSYTVQVDPLPNATTPSQGFLFTRPGKGADRKVDSDIDPATGKSGPVQVAAYKYNTDIDAGLLRVQVVGPAAVPGNSKYPYTVAVPGDQRASAVTWEVRGKDAATPLPAGAVAVATASGFPKYDAAENTTTYAADATFANTSPADAFIDIKQGGAARATREVYLVQVIVAAPDVNAAFTAGKPADYGTHNAGDSPAVQYGLGALNTGTAIKGVSSDKPQAVGQGLRWRAKVTLVGAGPDKTLGVDKIKVGFIQHIKPTTWRGTYEPAAAGGVDRTLTSSLQGKRFLDMGANPPGDPYAGRPWYDRRAEATLFAPTPTAGVGAVKEITSFDTPALGPPLTFEGATLAQLVANGIAAYKRLKHINLVVDFTLDVAASTDDDPALTTAAPDSSKALYWSAATATWSFDGTGAVSGLNPADLPKSFTWTPATPDKDNAALGEKNATSGAWAATSAPTQVDVSGDVFNTLLGTVKYA